MLSLSLARARVAGIVRQRAAFYEEPVAHARAHSLPPAPSSHIYLHLIYSGRCAAVRAAGIIQIEKTYKSAPQINTAWFERVLLLRKACALMKICIVRLEMSLYWSEGERRQVQASPRARCIRERKADAKQKQLHQTIIHAIFRLLTNSARQWKPHQEICQSKQ